MSVVGGGADGSGSECRLVVALPEELSERAAAAARVAGALAEAGVLSLRLADPRACATVELAARTTDLPKVILDAHPGTTLAWNGGSALIESDAITIVAGSEQGRILAAVLQPGGA